MLTVVEVANHRVTANLMLLSYNLVGNDVLFEVSLARTVSSTWEGGCGTGTR